jgi:hypothetical protein
MAFQRIALVNGLQDGGRGNDSVMYEIGSSLGKSKHGICNA